MRKQLLKKYLMLYSITFLVLFSIPIILLKNKMPLDENAIGSKYYHDYDIATDLTQMQSTPEPTIKIIDISYVYWPQLILDSLSTELLFDTAGVRYVRRENIQFPKKEPPEFRDNLIAGVKKESYYMVRRHVFIGNILLFGIINACIVGLIRKKRPTVFLPCPHCDKSVKIFDEWKCDFCNNFQERVHYITDKCDHCKRKLKTVFCEHCEKEFNL